jgi:hypothetical protein
MQVILPGSLCRVLVRAVLVLLVVSAPAALAGGPCVGEAPTSVLECLAQAYQARDVEAIDALYAPDFEFWNGTEESHNSWGRDEELKSATNLFTSKRVQEIRFGYEAPHEVVSGTEPNTWILRGVAMHLQLKDEQSPEPITIDGEKMEFRIRLVAEPSPHWQIYRWTDPNKP